MPLKLSKKTMLAVEAVVDVAFHGAGAPVQAKELALRQGVPPRFLEPAMQQLVHAGVLSSVRGPRGGYTLARETGDVTVGEIIRIISEMGGADAEVAGASELREKVVAPYWNATLGEFRDTLNGTTIADLCGQARIRGVSREEMTDLSAEQPARLAKSRSSRNQDGAQRRRA